MNYNNSHHQTWTPLSSVVLEAIKVFNLLVPGEINRVQADLICNKSVPVRFLEIFKGRQVIKLNSLHSPLINFFAETRSKATRLTLSARCSYLLLGLDETRPD